MTGPEWLASSDPWAMLQHLAGTGGDRKLRLFAAGCCREIWGSIATIRCRRAVETAERFADGAATSDDLRQARDLAWRSVRNTEAAGRRGRPELIYDHRLKLAAASTAPGPLELVEGMARLRLDRHLVSIAPGLLRCLFGPEPGRIPAFDPGWRTSTVVDLARAIYDDRAFDRLSILGDALEEAGCDSEAALGHCRDGGPHARGCWVVDQVLGRG